MLTVFHSRCRCPTGVSVSFFRTLFRVCLCSPRKSIKMYFCHPGDEIRLQYESAVNTEAVGPLEVHLAAICFCLVRKEQLVRAWRNKKGRQKTLNVKMNSDKPDCPAS